MSGIAGVISQGETWRGGRIAAFFSAKLTNAQANYPVHEIEMLAGVEAMRRHRDILLGTSFTWVTDHKGLIHLLRQKNLSGRQARWLESLGEFDFTIEYVPRGTDNVLADALSRIYAFDAPGTMRAPSEFTDYDEDEAWPRRLSQLGVTTPVITGLEANAVLIAQRRNTTRADDGKPVRKPRTKKPVEPAETGRPETAQEFSKRIKRVVLKAPPEQRQEGARVPSTSTDDETLTTEASAEFLHMFTMCLLT